jgi:hypothetical protein
MWVTEENADKNKRGRDQHLSTLKMESAGRVELTKLRGSTSYYNGVPETSSVRRLCRKCEMLIVVSSL